MYQKIEPVYIMGEFIIKNSIEDELVKISFILFFV